MLSSADSSFSNAANGLTADSVAIFLLVVSSVMAKSFLSHRSTIESMTNFKERVEDARIVKVKKRCLNLKRGCTHIELVAGTAYLVSTVDKDPYVCRKGDSLSVSQRS